MDWTAHEKREREKARELRQSSWWKNLRAKGLCHYCGKEFPPHQITMDHVIPIAAGGKSTISNIVPSCKNCNTQKKDHDPVAEAFAAIQKQKSE